ncbi:MAG: Dyp-type peroxidase [Microbacterium sp.]
MSSEPEQVSEQNHGLVRRDILRGAAAGAVGATIGALGGWFASGAFTTPDDGGTSRTDGQDGASADPVDPYGEHQAGVVVPATPQRHGFFMVLELSAVPEADAADEAFRVRLGSLLAAWGERIALLTAPSRAAAGEAARQSAGMFDGAGDLTVHIGVGSRVLAALDSTLPGVGELGPFVGDDMISADHLGGDLLVAAYGSSPNDVERAARDIAASAEAVSVRWVQRGFRAPGEGTITRNPLGFHDGVIVPRTAQERAENVWIDQGPLAGGTVCVIRRLQLAIERFQAEPLERQEAIIGRRRRDGSPLSGGEPFAEANLASKTAEGEFLIPARSHVRAAHPSFTGSALMLRRGYAFDNGAFGGLADAGLMFVCFQRDLRSFVQTQLRLDETDDLMAYATPTASGAFVILPGYSAERPLGSSLR